jgi:hypothetical protein
MPPTGFQLAVQVQMRSTARLLWGLRGLKWEEPHCERFMNPSRLPRGRANLFFVEIPTFLRAFRGTSF